MNLLIHCLMREEEQQRSADFFKESGVEEEILDARTASPTNLPFDLLWQLVDDITSQVPGVVSVTYNVACKPPSTIEAV
jgi:hypothetical protein